MTSRTILRWAVALLSAGLIAGAFSLDDATAAWVKETRTKSGKTLAGQVSHWGDAIPLLALGGAGFGVATWRRQDRWRRIFAGMLIAGSIAGITANLSRLTTGRTRPNAKVEQGWYGLYHEGKLLIGKNKFNSFPSGHTSMAFGFFAVLLMARRWPAGAVGMVAAGSVGASRVYLGVHHLSDVTVGALIGFYTAWWVWPRVDRFRRKWQVADPIAEVPRSGGKITAPSPRLPQPVVDGTRRRHRTGK